MDPIVSSQTGISRRVLFGGAACLALTVATRAGAASIAPPQDRFLLFGTSAGLQDAGQLVSADASLENRTVRVAITPFGDRGALPVRSIAVRFMVQDVPNGYIPFQAWAAGSPAASFKVPVHGTSGITFVVTESDGSESLLTLSGGSVAGTAKLREGTYFVGDPLSFPSKLLMRVAPPAYDSGSARLVVRTANGPVLSSASYLTLSISRTND